MLHTRNTRSPLTHPPFLHACLRPCRHPSPSPQTRQGSQQQSLRLLHPLMLPLLLPCQQGERGCCRQRHLPQPLLLLLLLRAAVDPCQPCVLLHWQALAPQQQQQQLRTTSAASCRHLLRQVLLVLPPPAAAASLQQQQHESCQPTHVHMQTATQCWCGALLASAVMPEYPQYAACHVMPAGLDCWCMQW